MTQFSFTPSFQKNLDEIIKELKKDNIKKILIQLPDGLKEIGDQIVEYFEKEGFLVFLWGNSNWGACDTPLHFKLEGIVDCIVHIGHEKFERKQGYLQTEVK